jgi:hypothetical protein
MRLSAPLPTAALRAVLEFKFLSRKIAVKQSMTDCRRAARRLEPFWPRTGVGLYDSELVFPGSIQYSVVPEPRNGLATALVNHGDFYETLSVANSLHKNRNSGIVIRRWMKGASRARRKAAAPPRMATTKG